MKGYSNEILIEIPEEERFITKRGRFDIDTSYDPAKHVKGYGKVVAIPHLLSGPECGAIQPVVKVGDEIRFHYLVVADDQNGNYLGEYDGRHIYKCSYFSAYCRRSSKEEPWEMIGGWVLCDPHFDKNVEMIEIDEKGTIAPAVLTESGLVAEVNVERSTRIAKLVNIGLPETDQPTLNVEVGDLVIFKQDMDSELELDGKKYLIMRQEELLAKYIPD